jgi:hypothetical protein
MRYRLRTLLILLAIMPPVLWIGWGKYQVWKAEQDRRAALMMQKPGALRSPIPRVKDDQGNWRPVAGSPLRSRTTTAKVSRAGKISEH